MQPAVRNPSSSQCRGRLGLRVTAVSERRRDRRSGARRGRRSIRSPVHCREPSPAFRRRCGRCRTAPPASSCGWRKRLDAPVWAGALTSRCGFPEDHRLFRGALPRRAQRPSRTRCASTNLVLVLGAPDSNYQHSPRGPVRGSPTRPCSRSSTIRGWPSGRGSSARASSRHSAPRLRALSAQVAPRPKVRSARPRPQPPPAERDQTSRIELLLDALAGELPRRTRSSSRKHRRRIRLLHDVLPLQPGRYPHRCQR